MPLCFLCCSWQCFCMLIDYYYYTVAAVAAATAVAAVFYLNVKLPLSLHLLLWLQSESTEWFVENQAFLRPYDSAPRLPPPPPPPLEQVVSLSQSSCASPDELTDCKEGGRGWARSQIMRPRESLALYKLFNTLWVQYNTVLHPKNMIPNHVLLNSLFCESHVPVYVWSHFNLNCVQSCA